MVNNNNKDLISTVLNSLPTTLSTSKEAYDIQKKLVKNTILNDAGQVFFLSVAIGVREGKKTPIDPKSGKKQFVRAEQIKKSNNGEDIKIFIQLLKSKNREIKIEQIKDLLIEYCEYGVRKLEKIYEEQNKEISFHKLSEKYK